MITFDKITLGDYLKYKDKLNEVSIRTANILSGQTCSKCCNKYSAPCRNKAADDSCWEWQEELKIDSIF